MSRKIAQYEDQLRLPTGTSETDAKTLADYNALVLSFTPETLRLMTWEDRGFAGAPGYAVTELLRSQDPPHDDDLTVEGIRFNTNSGVTLVTFLSVKEGDHQPVFDNLFGQYLDPNLPKLQLSQE